jgi:hypothetical protein
VTQDPSLPKYVISEKMTLAALLRIKLKSPKIVSLLKKCVTNGRCSGLSYFCQVVAFTAPISMLPCNYFLPEHLPFVTHFFKRETILGDFNFMRRSAASVIFSDITYFGREGSCVTPTLKVFLSDFLYFAPKTISSLCYNIYQLTKNISNFVFTYLWP